MNYITKKQSFGEHSEVTVKKTFKLSERDLPKTIENGPKIFLKTPNK